jgi:uncharacterized protein (UPF0548 family)
VISEIVSFSEPAKPNKKLVMYISVAVVIRLLHQETPAMTAVERI